MRECEWFRVSMQLASESRDAGSASRASVQAVVELRVRGRIDRMSLRAWVVCSAPVLASQLASCLSDLPQAAARVANLTTLVVKTDFLQDARLISQLFEKVLYTRLFHIKFMKSFGM